MRHFVYTIFGTLIITIVGAMFYGIGVACAKYGLDPQEAIGISFLVLAVLLLGYIVGRVLIERP